MKIKAIVVDMALPLAGRWALTKSVHLPQAAENTKTAITEGEAGHAPTLVEHAAVALDHAKASEKAEANSHTAVGIGASGGHHRYGQEG